MQPLVVRRISGKSFGGLYFLCLAGGAVLAVVLFLTPLALLSPLGFVPIIIAVIYGKLVQLSSSYRIFADRLEVESGLISRKIENIEMFRVRDIGLKQGLLGRILDFGDVFVHSTDASAPTLDVRGIDQPKEFYAILRDQVSASRAQGRTVIVEGDQPLR